MRKNPVELTEKDVKIVKEEVLYSGFYALKKYRLRHALFAGGWSEEFDREVVTRYRVAAALPYDPVLNRVVLIKQFRLGAITNEPSPWLWEIVAGIKTTDESLEEIAKRETFEESGLVVHAIKPICDYWVSPGGTQERVALFLVKVDSKNATGVYGLPEEHEDIFVKPWDVEEAFSMVRKGIINNALSIIALQWLELNLKKIKQEWTD